MTTYSFKATWKAATALPTDHFPLLLPGVHKLAAFFILRRLKKLGYSNCRVDSSSKGLVVYAQR
ncbi:hypothetical protein [Trichlorobacter sp.]|jgi:hypothetical protein|uniref:hypothetical protein n=1 Tax=Trichlorobacter sp. TaxID=2911007 RepID=UPI002A35BCBB|nr:hypothetical protein [Trichlorobacter sp.]MDY0385388.1 hypothetical protein [Trichlorobacter sp.]